MEETQFDLGFLGRFYGVGYIRSKDTAEAVLKVLLYRNYPLYALDTETMPRLEFKAYPGAGLDPHLSNIRLLQIAFESLDGPRALIFDLLHIGNHEIFKAFLTSAHFVGHNALFDLKFLFSDFAIKRCDIGCTYLMWKIISHATTPDDSGLRASLQVLTEKILGAPIHKELQVSDWSEPELTFEQLEYAALDPICTYLLAEKLVPAVERLGCHRYYRLCRAAQTPIARMQLNGIGFDAEAHLKLIDKWTMEVYEARKKVSAILGSDLVTTSSIADYLETNLPLAIKAIWPRTESGKLSVDANTLNDFEEVSSVVKPFSEFQKAEKLTTSFGINLQRNINPVTGRIHADYNICGARTGRLSCSHPNLQQLPRDFSVRSLFICNTPSKLVAADYSQIELRVGAELSRDKAMLESYRNGIDLHTKTAAVIGRKDIHDVTKEDRQLAKAFNFGLMFGLGPQKFKAYAKRSYGVEVTQDEAEESIEQWRSTYFGYRNWQLAQADHANEKGWTKTPCGKIRMLGEDNRYGAAMNTPVQGGACECMLAALVGIQRDIDDLSLKSLLCNCVHDEVICECPENEVETMKEIILNNMMDGFLYVFPNGITRGICEVGVGKNWGEAKS